MEDKKVCGMRFIRTISLHNQLVATFNISFNVKGKPNTFKFNSEAEADKYIAKRKDWKTFSDWKKLGWVEMEIVYTLPEGSKGFK